MTVFFVCAGLVGMLAVLLTLTTMYKGQQVPLMSIGDAIRDQAHAKRWLLIVAGLADPAMLVEVEVVAAK